MSITLANGRVVQLGRLKPKARPNALRLATYFDPKKLAKALPASVDFAAKAKAAIARVYLNDQLGCCVISGKMHQVGIWTGNDGPAAIEATDSEVSRAYRDICGPGDNGCNISEVLDVMQTRGLVVNGTAHKIDGYLFVDVTNKELVKAAIYIFGSLTLGINLPSAWTTTDQDWDVTNSRIVGGHDVCVCGYNERGVQICTWGDIVTITWAAFVQTRWLEEVYCQLSPDWYGSDKLSPGGIDAAALKADLAKIGGGTIPPIDPTPFPPVPPIPPGPAPTPAGNVLTLATPLPAGAYAVGVSAGVDPAKLLVILEELAALLGVQLPALPFEGLESLVNAKAIPWAILMQIVFLVIGIMTKPGGPTPADIQALIEAILAIFLGR